MAAVRKALLVDSDDSSDSGADLADGGFVTSEQPFELEHSTERCDSNEAVDNDAAVPAQERKSAANPGDDESQYATDQHSIEDLIERSNENGDGELQQMAGVGSSEELESARAVAEALARAEQLQVQGSCSQGNDVR